MRVIASVLVFILIFALNMFIYWCYGGDFERGDMLGKWVCDGAVISIVITFFASIIIWSRE